MRTQDKSPLQVSARTRLVLPSSFMKAWCRRVPTSATLARSPVDRNLVLLRLANRRQRSGGPCRLVQTVVMEDIGLMNEQGTAVAQSRPRRADGIPDDSRRSDRPIERCHNTVGQGMRSVDAGSLSLRVTQKIGTREDRKSTRLNSSHIQKSRMPSSA